MATWQQMCRISTLKGEKLLIVDSIDLGVRFPSSDYLGCVVTNQCLGFDKWKGF